MGSPKQQNELTVNSQEDVAFHLPQERVKISEGAKLLTSAVTDLEAALQAGDEAQILAASNSVTEYLENLFSAGSNVKICVDFVANFQSSK